MKVNIRATREDEKELEAFDFSKLSAINTCPTWGIMRYGYHKTMRAGLTSAALAAGSASHDVYAACRLWQLGKKDGFPGLMEYHGKRLFGEERFTEMVPHFSGNDRTNFMAFCLEALYSFGIIDSPGEKRKSLANIEESCIAYLDKQLDAEFPYPIWIRDKNDPQSDVGIEVPFDLILEFEDGVKVRFIGKIDGLQWHGTDLWLHENKTASRLNDAWARSFALSHQITGYTLAASFISQTNVHECRVQGMAIPLPRTADYGGLVDEDVSREDHHLVQWFAWLRHTIDIYNEHKSSPATAPKYTHSCNRYFRPCMFIDYCAETDDGKREIWEFLEEEKWSPLEEKTAD